MKRKMIFLLLVLAISGFSAAADSGQAGHRTVRSITMNDGLPTNAVRCIVQDKYGFVWFGTDNGLCRYDGYTVQTFTIPQQKLDQYVGSLCAVDDGLLVGTPDGAFRFSYRTETFEKLYDGIHAQVNNFRLDADSILWMSTGGEGLYRYNLHTRQCHRYPFRQWKGRVETVFVDDNNQVWAFGSPGGSLPYRLNKSTGTFERFALQREGGLSGFCILQGAGGTLLVGCWEQGLLQVAADGKVEQLLNPRITGVGYHIHAMYRESENLIYIGCDEGLMEFDLQKKSWRMLSQSADSGHAISERFVYSIMGDREGGLWIGSFYGGVSYFAARGERFHSYTDGTASDQLHGSIVGRFCEDSQHRIWVASDDGGLNCLDPSTGRFLDYPGRSAMAALNVHALLAEGNRLWVGTYGDGIVCMDLQSGNRHVYQFEDQRVSSSCYCLYRDARHRLWATSMDGAYLYDEAKDRFHKIKNFQSLTIDIDQDSRGNLWFATQGKGVWCCRAGGAWQQYQCSEKDTLTLASNQVNSLALGPQGQLYAGTQGGLCLYDATNDRFRRIPLHTPSNDICGIVMNQEEMWLSTTKGIIRYTPGEPLQVYNRYDGLTGDQFQPNSGLMASDGRIYFGGTRGFNAFYPHMIKVNQIAPPVFITSLELYNQHVPVGTEKLPESLSHIDQVDLSYGDDMFSISFAALSYISPEKNQYAYMLEGFDRDWIYSGDDHKATYTNIPAGTYTFRVKATNNDGVWSTQEARLKIVVHPPFWWAWPAKLLYLFLIGYLIYLYTQLKVRKEKRLHQREMELLTQKNEQEARDARLQFFTMIAHEIRTPVSLIIGPLENLKAEWQKISRSVKNGEAMSGTLDIIDRNAQRLLDLVNQLLDFNKVQQRGMQVRFQLQNISRLMHAVAERFEPTLQKNGARLEVTYPADDFVAVIDKEAITKVISNLMTNATKYTHDYVHLSCELADGDRFRILVADNGDGVQSDEQQKIFGAFYQAKDNKPGTGIGLSIVKNLVEAHHGMVEVQSEPGRGATFIVTLPIQQQDFAVGEEDASVYRMVEDAEEPVAETQSGGETIPAATEKKMRKSCMLVVEDDRDMREFIASRFREGYEVVTAEHGVEALRLLGKHQVNFIVSDWMMPEMDGAELCRRVRLNPLTSHIPFIMLTAKTDNDSKTEGMNCGADAYIEKPFSIKYLEACVRNLQEMRRLLQSKYSDTPLEPITEMATTPVDEDFLEKLNRLIEENVDNEKLNVVFLAEQVGMSRSSLFAKIKGLTDKTPNEMIQLVKLKKAAQLLTSGKYRVNEVGYMVGYSSASYFAKCFAKQFGVTPTEFVENM